MNFEVKKATTDDAEVLTDIRNEALAFKLSQGDTAWGDAPFTHQEILEAIARKTLYLVRVDGKPAASVVLFWENRIDWGESGTDEQAGYIANLAVADNFRGQNIGRSILDWAGQQILAAQRESIRLDCPAGNTKLCAYYMNQGFVRMNADNSGKALFERHV